MFRGIIILSLLCFSGASEAYAVSTRGHDRLAPFRADSKAQKACQERARDLLASKWAASMGCSLGFNLLNLATFARNLDRHPADRPFEVAETDRKQVPVVSFTLAF
jgi:hypothetical protein